MEIKRLSRTEEQMYMAGRGKGGKAMVTAVIVAVVLLVLLAAGSWLLANYVLTGRRQTLEEARAWQEEHYDFSFYDIIEKTDYTVTSDDGYMLHAQFLRNPAGGNRYMLMTHGYTDNRLGMMKYVRIFLDQGFHVIVYDLRGHGMNEPALCTYSMLERKDLLAMIRDSRERYPEMEIFGLHGESLGAATSVAVLQEKPPLDFVIADCGFSEILPVIQGLLKGMHVPSFMAEAASIWAKIRTGWSFREMRPIDSLRDNEIPLLFIHGETDSLIPPEHSLRMKEATRGYAELLLFPGAGHASCVFADPERYAETVRAFVKKVIAGEKSPEGYREP